MCSNLYYSSGQVFVIPMTDLQFQLQNDLPLPIIRLLRQAYNASKRILQHFLDIVATVPLQLSCLNQLAKVKNNWLIKVNCGKLASCTSLCLLLQFQRDDKSTPQPTDCSLSYRGDVVISFQWQQRSIRLHLDFRISH